ncbi:hypothetical protein ID0481_06170 [Helicobacter pylori]
MSDCKMSRVSRELFNNIKSFLHHKLKTMIRIQSMNDLQLVLKWQDRVLECQSLIALKELNRKLYNQGIRHTIMMQGLFLFFEYFDNRIKLKSLHNLAEEQVIDFLFGLAKNRKSSSLAKYCPVYTTDADDNPLCSYLVAYRYMNNKNTQQINNTFTTNKQYIPTTIYILTTH